MTEIKKETVPVVSKKGKGKQSNKKTGEKKPVAADMREEKNRWYGVESIYGSVGT